MRILLASSEVHPYSKTGGLADMVGSLAKTLARAGHEVGIVTPLYAGIRERFPLLKPTPPTLDVPLGDRRVRGEVWELKPMDRLSVYLVGQPDFFERPALYQERGVDYPDNAERYVFFSKAVAHLALNLPWRPQVVHAHDWQTGFVALLLAHQRRNAGGAVVPGTCMTVHNLAYQGLFPAGQYGLLDLPGEYFTPAGAEFHGRLGGLKAGLAFADVVTAVSPRYAREITTPEYGCGLDGLLRHRQGALTGILNGIDYDEWNPLRDTNIMYPYSADRLDGKIANKLHLQRELGLTVDRAVPLFGKIGRLIEQKGVDLTLGALEEMLSTGLQFVLVGTGEAVFEAAYRDLARRFPAQVAVRIVFDEALSHRVEAACDFFLMPSRFEPCGLNQMYSLRYGTVPIVRATGGLDDTVIDVRQDAERANGIKFDEPSAQALVKAIRKALALFGEEELLERFRLNGMAVDFSWGRTMAEYVKVYEKVVTG